MKNLFFLTIIFIFTPSFSQEKSLIGYWKNIGQLNSVNGFTFNSDNTAFLHNENNMLSPVFNLKIDYTKKPIWLDMNLTKDDIDVEFFGLVEFIDEKTIKFKIYRGHYENHPLDFSESSRSEVLFTLQKSE